MNTKQLYERGMEGFSWLLLGAEDALKSDRSRFDKEIKYLRGIINLASDYAKDEEIKRWLIFSLEELDKSYDAFIKSNWDAAYKALDCSEQYFCDARNLKKSKATFIVDPDGQTEKL